MFNRRMFLGSLAVTPLLPTIISANANDRIAIGVMGMGGRGRALATQLAKLPNVDVLMVADPDEKRAAAGSVDVEKAGGKAAKIVADFRRMLDDKSIDALVCAAPNHWHAPAGILASQAGKHAYIEKPCSHTPEEGELLVAAARKHQRLVQMGNQRRTWTGIQEAIAKLQEGVIGRVYHASCWYRNNRPTIGKGEAISPPKELNYALWQGPSKHIPFQSNYLHYNWHWFWHWGNGELGNNGVHMIDVCRWGLGVSYPIRVTSAGGRYHFQDDQQTPDTHVVHFEFADRKMITWDGQSCLSSPKDTIHDVLFIGEKGSLSIRGSAYFIFDEKGKQIQTKAGSGGENDHLINWIEAIRGKTKLNSEIEQGHQSTLLCHLGNIAHRTGRSLQTDPSNGHILNDVAATKYWTKEYEPAFDIRG